MRPTASGAGILADPRTGWASRPEKRSLFCARRVILSAGYALGSPAILLRSKVPNENIGRGAVLHASMPVLGKFDRTVDALSGTQASVFVDEFLFSRGYAMESMSAEPLYAANMAMGPARFSFDLMTSYRNLGGFGVMLAEYRRRLEIAFASMPMASRRSTIRYPTPTKSASELELPKPCESCSVPGRSRCIFRPTRTC